MIIRIVPDDRPNAEATEHEIPEDTDTGGTWHEAEQAAAPHIPEGWHMVGVGPAPQG